MNGIECRALPSLCLCWCGIRDSQLTLIGVVFKIFCHNMPQLTLIGVGYLHSMSLPMPIRWSGVGWVFHDAIQIISFKVVPILTLCSRLLMQGEENSCLHSPGTTPSACKGCCICSEIGGVSARQCHWEWAWIWDAVTAAASSTAAESAATASRRQSRCSPPGYDGEESQQGADSLPQ